MTKTIYIGTSGWQYSHWRGVFYPRELARAEWLSYYARTFLTVEINSSFYHLPTEKTLEHCYNATPDDFIFSVKASRYITHIKRLRGVDQAVTSFVSRARLLKQKLGPVLYQLPPSLRRNDELLEEFLTLLPQDLESFIEFRHRSWLTEEVFGILRRHQTGFCIYDMPQVRTPLVVTTATSAYIRLHGSEELYYSSYTDAELGEWAANIASLEARRVFVYFNNDAGGHAVDNALSLRHLVAPTAQLGNSALL